jgi:D-galactarolactone cycloisomerase
MGFNAFKVKVGLDVRNDIDCLHAIRAAVGYDVDVLVDANQCYSRHLALQVGRELEKLQVLFFEEPLPTDDVEGHRFLADKLDIRIATGENMYTRWDFMPFLTAGAVHVVQADASRCGGISELRKIADIASGLHVAAATTNAPVMEYDRTWNPLQEELVTNPPAVHDSVIELPAGPGLGVDIDWDFVADHPWSDEIGIGLASRPAFGLATEIIPDRTATSLS